MEGKYKKLRLELDELGYKQKFDPTSFSLIEKLFSDLKTTTENLRKYMKIAQNAIEERDSLQFGAEPYKCDNARLVKECNELHLKLLKSKEEHEKIQIELKHQINLSQQIKQREEKLLKRIRQLEIELANYKSGKSKITSSKSDQFQIDSAMALADQKIANLTHEIRSLNDQILQLMETVEICENQISLRDQEIERLQKMLEGGRPTNTLKKECCYRDLGNTIKNLQDELKKVTNEKNCIDNRLQEALSKQHEAMKRALHLAERNKQLEKEMKEIDEMALTVESDCNSKIKTQAETIKRLQNRIQEVITQLQELERENEKLRKDKQDVDGILMEKKQLQSVLETSLEEKKRLTDKINRFTIIEQDLNKEIDRLMQQCSQQKRQIVELESKVNKSFQEESEDIDPKSTKKVSKKKSFNGQNKIVQKDSISITSGNGSKKCCATCRCICDSSKHFKELLDKEMEYRQSQANRCIDTLNAEKDYFMKEYHRVLEQLKNIPKSDTFSELMQKLNEKESAITNLQQEIRALSQENHSLMTRLESTRKDDTDSVGSGKCTRASCKKTEREKELLKRELDQLQEERDVLKAKLQSALEGQSLETDRYKKTISELEEEIRRVKREANDLKYEQGSRRSLLDNLEEQCNYLKEQLRETQNELNQQKLSYNQLKALHEQSDRNLQDTRNKLVQCETQLANAKDELKRRDYSKEDVEKEIELLKNDIHILKKQLTKLDQEKDELMMALDQKTEKIATLTLELESKDKSIDALESLLCDLKKKLSLVIDENNNNQHLLRNYEVEIENLKRELESAQRIKDSTMNENRRLQDDLSSVSVDCRNARNELEICRRQVDDLKRQLQHYVAEVKRAEDLISQKEVERNEILDQYKCLTEEANLLETNNHTLENQASQSKVQLSVALDHAAELERKLQDQDSIIRSYERQIAELTSQVASLEIQLKQNNTQLQRTESELNHMRELCLKLDNENDRVKRQSRETESRLQLPEHRVETSLDSDRENFSRLQDEFYKMQDRVRELEDRFALCICGRRENLPDNNNLNDKNKKISPTDSYTNKLRCEGNVFDFELRDKVSQCELRGSSIHFNLRRRRFNPNDYNSNSNDR